MNITYHSIKFHDCHLYSETRATEPKFLLYPPSLNSIALLQAFTGKILAAFVAGLGDRNPAVRKTFASSIGHLMKTAKDSSVEKLFTKLRTWYMTKSEDQDVSTKWLVFI